MSKQDVLVNIPEQLLIKPGDTVERIFSDNRHEYKVKDAGNGRLKVTYRFWRGSWMDWEGTQAEIHKMWRKVTKSPAVRFIEMFANKTPIKSRQKLHGFYHSVIKMAVEGGLKFHAGDFSRLSKEYGVWFGQDYDYAMTVESGNKSAIKVLEKDLGHEPYWYKTLENKPRRLYVGASFTWEGLLVSVTSFKPEHMIACHQEREGHTTKTKRVFRITREDLEYRYQQWIKLAALRDYLSITHPSPERRWGYQQEDGCEVRCESCADGWPGRKYLDYSSHFINDAVFAECDKCGHALITNPGAETAAAMLKKLQIELTAETAVSTLKTIPLLGQVTSTKAGVDALLKLADQARELLSEEA